MLEIGSLVDNKYRVLDVVGSGGMSAVYLVRNEKANKSWAIKEVLKQGEENLEIKKNSLIAETEMLKKLNHPNLPAIVDVIETNNTYLVVMDYIEGNDLGDIVTEFGAQPQEKVVEWGKQICDVLNYLHTRNPVIIYRDLKPANIMLKPDGNVTLIDFGTAREAEVKDVANTISLGTRGYAAPEQFGDGARADARTDIYCFGATLYHLVTGHNPAEEPYVIEPIRNINPSLSGGLEKIILKCTKANPAERYQDCTELMYDLEHYREIDDLYRKKQKKKLSVFMTSVAIMFICIGVSVFGYYENNLQIGVIYNQYISNGKYIEAVKVQPENIKAYNDAIENINQKGEITDQDTAELFGKFIDVENTSNNGELIHPIYELAQSNVSDFIDVCYSVGYSYWEYYKTESSRAEKACVWFKQILPENFEKKDITNYKEGDSYTIIVNGQEYTVVIGNEGNISYDKFQIAFVCVQINECKSNIKSYSNAKASLNSLSGEDDLSKAYKALWKNLTQLKKLAENVNDQQLKIVLSNEILLETDLYKKELITNNELSREEIVDNFIDSIKYMIETISPTSDLIASNKDEMLKKSDSLSKKISQEYEKLGG